MIDVQYQAQCKLLLQINNWDQYEKLIVGGTKVIDNFIYIFKT